MKLGLAAVLACFLVAACSGDEGASTTTSDQTNTPNPPTSATTSPPPTTMQSETEIEGRLPDGREYVVSFDPGVDSPEPDGVFAFIVVDLDQVDVTPEDLGCEEACTPVLGVTRFTRESGQSSTFEDGIVRITSGDWTMQIAVYQNILDVWDTDTSALLDSIEPVDIAVGLPAFNLSSPLRWATDTEIPNQMGVRYPSFVVRRGCGELSIACSPSGAVQVIPSDKVYTPAPPWDDNVTVSVSDVP